MSKSVFRKPAFLVTAHLLVLVLCFIAFFYWRIYVQDIGTKLLFALLSVLLLIPLVLVSKKFADKRHKKILEWAQKKGWRGEPSQMLPGLIRKSNVVRGEHGGRKWQIYDLNRGRTVSRTIFETSLINNEFNVENKTRISSRFIKDNTDSNALQAKIESLNMQSSAYLDEKSFYFERTQSFTQPEDMDEYLRQANDIFDLLESEITSKQSNN